MKIKLFNKILIVVLMLLMVSSLTPIKVNAMSDMFEAADNFLAKGKSPRTVIDETQLQSTSGTIYKWLMTIAICVAVIIGAIIGVQFIIGSVEGKAKIQEALVPYVVGCVVIFGSFFIWKTLVNTGNSLEGDVDTYVTYHYDGGDAICDSCGQTIPPDALHAGKCVTCNKDIDPTWYVDTGHTSGKF